MSPRDYVQDMEAVLLSKPSRMTVEMLAMWQDHVGHSMAKVAGNDAVADKSVDVEEAQDWSLVHIYKVLHVYIHISQHTHAHILKCWYVCIMFECS